MSSAPWLDGPADCFPRSYLLACTSTQQYQRLPNYDCGIAEFFSQPSRRDDMWFWRTFAKPVKGAKRTQRYRPDAVAKIEQPSRLEQLPNELVDVVLDALIGLGDRASVLALGLASSVLYPVILARIHRDYASEGAVAWAGEKVGFLGGDSPVVPALVTADSHDFFEYISMAIEPWPTREGYEEVCMGSEKAWRDALGDVWSLCEKTQESAWKDVGEDLSNSYMYPKDRGWVLRNLTTRQCVRDDALVPPQQIFEDELVLDEVVKLQMFNGGSELYDPGKPGKELVPANALEAFSLPQVFLVLTAHSGHPGWTEEDVGFGWGPWVNHRFEVVSLEEHGDTSEWEDVTTEVAADLGHLRWCVMQHIALMQCNADRRWQTMRDFRERVERVRAKWTYWIKRERSGI